MRRKSEILRYREFAQELTGEAFRLLRPRQTFESAQTDFKSIELKQFKRVWENLQYLLKEELEELVLPTGKGDAHSCFWGFPNLALEYCDLNIKLGVVPAHAPIIVSYKRQALWSVRGDGCRLGTQEFSLPDYAILAVFHLVGPNVSGAAICAEFKKRNFPGCNRIRERLSDLVGQNVISKHEGRNGYFLNEDIKNVDWPAELKKCAKAYRNNYKSSAKSRHSSLPAQE